MVKVVLSHLLKGHTLIEAVLVIALVGVLAVSAIPKLFEHSLTIARRHTMNATVGAVQIGTVHYSTQQESLGNGFVYPTVLDSVTGAASGVLATGLAPLFTVVTQNGVSSHWFKISNTCYAYDTNGNGTYDSGTDESFHYDSANGTFKQGSAC